MKINPLMSITMVVSLVMSSVSLGYQIKGKTPSKFEKYMVPTKETELERRFALADMAMVFDGVPMDQGISLGRVWGISNNQIVVRRLVSEKGLPVTYDERKKALQNAAIGSAGSVMAQFGKDELSLEDVRVEFVSFDDLVQNSNKTYAVFSNGELTFH